MNNINLNNELVILEVSGIDAKKYLQGQLTNDINLLEQKSFIYALHLNNKGRAIASMIIIKPVDNVYYLITAKSTLQTLITRLKMYVLRSKVQISELTDLYITYDNLAQSSTKYSISLTNSDYLNIQNDLNNNNSLDTNSWHKFLIMHRIPFIYQETQEEFIPQHIDYDFINGISYTKGCYTGQEIVARTHYLGKTKRKMFKFITTNQVLPGQDIISNQMNNQVIGKIIDSCKSDGQYMGLASMQIEGSEDAFVNNIKLEILTD